MGLNNLFKQKRTITTTRNLPILRGGRVPDFSGNNAEKKFDSANADRQIKKTQERLRAHIQSIDNAVRGRSFQLQTRTATRTATATITMTEEYTLRGPRQNSVFGRRNDRRDRQPDLRFIWGDNTQNCDNKNGNKKETSTQQRKAEKWQPYNDYINKIEKEINEKFEKRFQPSSKPYIFEFTDEEDSNHDEETTIQDESTMDGDIQIERVLLDENDEIQRNEQFNKNRYNDRLERRQSKTKMRQQNANQNLSKKQVNDFYDAQREGHRDLLIHGYRRHDYKAEARPPPDIRKIDMDDFSDGEKESIERIINLMEETKREKRKLEKAEYEELIRADALVEWLTQKRTKTDIAREKVEKLKDKVKTTIKPMTEQEKKERKLPPIETDVVEKEKPMEVIEEKVSKEKELEERKKRIVPVVRIPDEIIEKLKDEKTSPKTRRRIRGHVQKQHENVQKEAEIIRSKLTNEDKQAKTTSETDKVEKTRSTENDATKHWVDRDWQYMSDYDFASIRDRKKNVTTQAVTRVLHDKVKEHNDRVGFNDISLVHPDYMHYREMREQGRTDVILNPADFEAFSSPENNRVLIPIIEGDEYILIEATRPRLGLANANVYDPNFKADKKLSKNEVSNILNEIKDDTWDTVKVRNAGSGDIKKQSSEKKSGGIIMIQNVEAICKSKHSRDSAKLKNLYEKDCKERKTTKSRSRIHNEVMHSLYGINVKEEKEAKKSTRTSTEAARSSITHNTDTRRNQAQQQQQQQQQHQNNASQNETTTTDTTIREVIPKTSGKDEIESMRRTRTSLFGSSNQTGTNHHTKSYQLSPSQTPSAPSHNSQTDSTSRNQVNNESVKNKVEQSVVEPSGDKKPNGKYIGESLITGKKVYNTCEEDAKERQRIKGAKITQRHLLKTTRCEEKCRGEQHKPENLDSNQRTKNEMGNASNATTTSTSTTTTTAYHNLHNNAPSDTRCQVEAKSHSEQQKPANLGSPQQTENGVSDATNATNVSNITTTVYHNLPKNVPSDTRSQVEAKSHSEQRKPANLGPSQQTENGVGDATNATNVSHITTTVCHNLSKNVPSDTRSQVGAKCSSEQKSEIASNQQTKREVGNATNTTFISTATTTIHHNLQNSTQNKTKSEVKHKAENGSRVDLQIPIKLHCQKEHETSTDTKPSFVAYSGFLHERGQNTTEKLKNFMKYANTKSSSKTIVKRHQKLQSTNHEIKSPTQNATPLFQEDMRILENVVRRILGGVKRRRTLTRNREYDIPDVLLNTGWDQLEKVDIDSVRNVREEVTNVAIFKILHQLVQTHNDEMNKNEIAITDLTYFDAVKLSITTGSQDVDVDRYLCFKDQENIRVLIPVLTRFHYLLIEVNKSMTGKPEVNVYDPLFTGTYVTNEEVKAAVYTLGITSFQNVEPNFATRTDIINQMDTVSCGIHLIQNVKAIIRNPLHHGSNLMRSYPSDVKKLTLEEQREQLAVAIDPESADYVTSNSTKRVDFDDEMQHTHKKPQVTVSDSQTLSSNFKAESWSAEKCLCSMDIKNEKERTERTEKTRITSKCGGNLTKIGSLAQSKHQSMYGTENIADLILCRVTGICNIDWKHDEDRKSWTNIAICNNHLLEFTTGFLDKLSKGYSHVNVSHRGATHKFACSWPTNAIDAHTKTRPEAKNHVLKNETDQILRTEGFLLPPGLPVCQHHKTFIANKLIEETITSRITNIVPTSPTSGKINQLQNLFNSVFALKNTENNRPDDSTPANQMEQQTRERIESSKAPVCDDVILKTITNIENLVNDDFRKISNQIGQQLTANILRHKEEHLGMYALRLLGHIRFHVCKVGDKSSDVLNIIDVYPKLYKAFMGINDELMHKDSNKTSVVPSSSSSSSTSSTATPSPSSSPTKNQHDEQNNQFVPGIEMTKKISKNTKKIAMDRNVEEKLDNDLIDIYGPELHDAQQDTRDVAKKITKVRLCNSRCPRVNKKHAIIVYNRVRQLSDCTNIEEQEKILQILFKKLSPTLHMTVKQWIEKHKPCFQGLRSLNKRLTESDRLHMIKQLILSAKTGSNADIANVINLDCLPDHLIQKFNRLYAEKKSVKHHTQQEVRKRFGKHENAFKSSMMDVEDTVCDICTQLTVRSELHRKAGQMIRPIFLVPGKYGAKHYDICRMCWREIVKNKIPHGALVNRMESDENPEVLRQLNPIEKMLIQRVRAIQNIFQLQDIGGRKTAMKGTKGVLVLVPVAIDNTMKHVSEVLPNASKMIIHVKTSWEKVYLVSMPRIVTALTWLKDNNRHYADITIDEMFDFQIGKNLVFEKENVSSTDIENLILRRNPLEDDHLLTQGDFDVQPMRKVIPLLDDETLAVERFLMKKDKYRPLSIDEPHIDEKVLPALHPKGRFGMSEERARKTTMVKYTRHRLLQKDRRFATDPHWYTLMFGLKTQKAITSTLGIQARVKRGAPKADLRLEDPAFTTTMNSFTKKLRGSPAYWQKCRHELRSHISSFGNPTFFLTLNSNEKEWTDLHQLYTRITGHEVNADNIQLEIAHDPTIYSRYWQRRRRAFFKEVLLVPNGPLGNITHFFWRVEYQHRGTQHVHCLLWTKERPPSDAKSSDITNYLDQYITARLPSMTEEPELHAIIEGQQKHWKKHSKTCLRITKYRGKIMKRCRFDFPRPELRRTTHYKEKSAILLPGLDKREYYLARDECDVLVNDYNPAISLIWNGNTDVQMISANSAGVCNYVSAYTTKGEKAKKANDEVSINVPSVSNMAGETFKQLINITNNRQTGALELVDDLLGHNNYEFDRGHTFIVNDPTEKRVRTLKPAETLKKLKPTDVCYLDNILDVYYPGRHQMLAEYCLFNIMINFDVVNIARAKTTIYGREKDIIIDSDEDDDELEELLNTEILSTGTTDDDYHYHDKFSPLYDHGYLEIGKAISLPNSKTKVFRKRRQTIARFFLPELDWNDDACVEDFFRRLCIMFISWTNEETILQDRNKDSYMEAFIDYKEELAEKSVNAANDLHKIVSNFLELKRNDRRIALQLDALKKAMEELKIDQELNEEIEIQKRIVDEKKHESAKKSMNEGQKDIFNTIISTIENQERNKELEEEHEGLRWFISGTAGVGKSFIINCLADELTLSYTNQEEQGLRPAVLIAAPTGLAAIGVKGTTIHTLFNIEVQHGRDSPFAAMRDAMRDMKRALFSNVKLIIIDELSMCSNITFMKIHCRLQEILGSTDIFGNANIVAFGDLLQLPPVLAPRIFETINPYQMRHIFGSISVSINLWNTLEYHELKENMRQKEDLEFAELMGRARLQALTANDIETFCGRIVATKSGNPRATYEEMAEFFVELQQKDPGALALFATNAEATEFNGQVMKLRQMDTTRITATETAVASAKERARSRNARTQKIWQRKAFSLFGKIKNLANKDVSEIQSTINSPNIAGGLPLVLDIAVNARVMLRRNIDTPNGLVNGATGTLESIERDINNHVKALMIRFDNNTDTLKRIERISVYYDAGFEERRCRNQFPIVMAFGATIHKAQGLTLNNVLLSTRSMFCSGQFFVGASRVQNINGLHLADFHAEKVLVDIKSLIEYNRLRTSIDLPPFDIPATRTRKERSTRTADGNVVVVVGETKKKEKTRKVRTFVDSEEATSAEIQRAIPLLMETEEFSGSEKQMVHAVLLCIIMMTSIRRALLDFRNDEHISFATLTLAMLMDGGYQCVDYLMRNVRKQLVNPTLMFEACFENLPSNLQKLAEREIMTKDKCAKCHHETIKTQKSHVINIIEENCGNIEAIIDSMFQKKALLQTSCKKCKTKKVVRTRIDRTDPEFIQYAIVVISSRKNKFDRLRQDGSHFLNSRWHCIVIVKNIGTIDQVTCMSQPNGGYFIVTHNEMTTATLKPPFVNTNILIFKIKPYERMPKEQPLTRYIEEVPEFFPDSDSDYDDDVDVDEPSNEMELKTATSEIEPLATSTNTIKLLQLKNSGTDCFVNTSVNILHSMQQFRQNVLTYSIETVNGIIEEIQTIFQGQTNDSIKLRQELSTQLHKGQHDINDALNEMLEKIPDNMQDSFTMLYSTVITCSSGCKKIQNDENRTMIFWLNTTNKTSTIGSIEEVETKKKRCSKCQKEATLTCKYNTTSTTRNILISRPDLQSQTYMLPDCNAIISLFQQDWQITAIASYRPANRISMGKEGHWVTWRKDGSHWMLLDDNHITETSYINELDMENSVLFVLETISYK